MEEIVQLDEEAAIDQAKVDAALKRLDEWRARRGGVIGRLSGRQVESLNLYCDMKYIRGSTDGSVSTFYLEILRALSGVTVPADAIDSFLRISARVREADALLHRYGKEYRTRMRVALSTDLLSPEEQEVLDIYRSTVGAHLAQVRHARDAEVARHKAAMAELEARERIDPGALGPFADYHAARMRAVSAYEPDDIVAAFDKVGGDVKKMRVAMKSAKRDATVNALPPLEAARIFREERDARAAEYEAARSAAQGSA
uniref:ORF2 n=1 Tax=Plasmopara viticola lesion associated picorna-like virus 1 TaxID=2692077 RepID=A0A6B9Q4G8_9VIRU|nr:ORF2 [Plasmopara viticola lesion associated picorna-like virus 1]